MQTVDFKEAIEKLIEIAKEQTTIIMCAQAVVWRCHRSLIGDVLLVRNFDVEDVFSKTNVKKHVLTPWAVVHRTTITYPKK